MLNTEGFSAADLAAVIGNNNDGFGGGNGAWWLLILLIFANNGWGNNNGYGNGNGGYMPYMPPYATANDVQSGFDQAAIVSGINSITSALSNGFANAEISRGNQLAAITNQMNNIAMNQQSCCCENRLATANLTGTVQTEAAANRYADANNTRDIIENCNRNNQAILDKLCQLELDGVRQNYETRLAAMSAQNAQLQSDLTAARFAASQGAQTAQILANNEAQTAALEQYLSPVPKPAYLVGNPNCCGNYYTSNCGCGINA